MFLVHVFLCTCFFARVSYARVSYRNARSRYRPTKTSPWMGRLEKWLAGYRTPNKGTRQPNTDPHCPPAIWPLKPRAGAISSNHIVPGAKGSSCEIRKPSPTGEATTRPGPMPEEGSRNIGDYTTPSCALTRAHAPHRRRDSSGEGPMRGVGSVRPS